MDNYSKNKEKDKLPTIIFIISEIVFIIFAIITFKWLSAVEEIISTVSIESSLYDTSEERKIEIEHDIFEIVALNSQDVFNANFKAKIRDGSEKIINIKELDVTLKQYLVDIDELQQTYKIVDIWSDDKNNNFKYSYQGMLETVFCAEIEEWKYDEYKCKDYSRNHGTDYLISAIMTSIPFRYSYYLSEKDFDFETMKIEFYPKDYDKYTTENSINELKDYVEFLGFNRNRYDFWYTEIKGDI